MIPTTDAELLTFNTPGDVSRRILLEPFHFSWEISSNESTLTDLEAVGVDLSGNLMAIKRVSAGYVQIYTVMDSGDPINIFPGSAVLSVKWFGDSYYHTVGTSVYRDGVLLFTANGIVDTIGVAADSDVYFSYRNSGTNHLAHYHDSAIEYSDIYWCGDIDNLDAIRLSDHDVIVMSCEFPSNLVTDVESGEIVWVEEEHYGIAAMNVHGNLWSDHYTIDVNENENQIISSGHAFKISDTKVGVAYQSSIYGTLYNFFSTSVNGRTWIFPIPMIVPTSASQPLYIMKDNYVYAFGSGVIHKSPGFRLFGVQPEQYDITSNVLACSLVTDQRSGVTLEVNYSQELWDYLEEGDVLLQMYAGYVYSDASVEKLVFVGELDLHGKRAGFEATNTVELPFRDVTSWLDRSKAPVAVEADAITTLLDNYDDPEGTGYGGLSRTAAYHGSWKTDDGQLTPLANGANVAFNTSGNSVNGEIAVAGTFTEPTTDVLGVIYRGISDKHMMRLVYYASTRMLTIERADGEDNVTAIAAVGQSFSNQVAMIRAIFRYGLHIGQVSTDGISWSTVLTKIYGEHNYYGAMGLYANQYVPDITDPWEPEWPDTPFEPPPLPEPIDVLPGTDIAVVYRDGGELEIFYCADVTVAVPHWEDITANFPGVHDFGAIAIFGGRVWATCDNAVYYCNPASPTWTSFPVLDGYVYRYGAGKRSFVQVSPSGMYMFIDVWYGSGRHAWVLNDSFETEFITKVGIQNLTGTLHASWSGDTNICSGHSDLPESAAGCDTELYNSEPEGPGEGCTVDTTEPNSTAEVVLKLVDDSVDCWYYAWVSVEATYVGMNDSDYTGFKIFSQYTFTSLTTYGQVYVNGEWVLSTTYKHEEILDPYEEDSTNVGESFLIRVRKNGAMRVRAQTGRTLVFIDVIDTNARVCWESSGVEEYSIGSEREASHLIVPLGYTGLLEDLVPECCGTGDEINYCPPWAIHEVRQFPEQGMLAYIGSTLTVGDPDDDCDAETVVTASPIINSTNRGVNVVEIGDYQYAISTNNSELQISTDNFITHANESFPAYLGDVFPSLDVFGGAYLIVYGTTGVAAYHATNGWQNITGDLIPGGTIGGFSNIGASR